MSAAEIGRFIAERRKEKGLSLAKLARKTGVSSSVISSIEKDRNGINLVSAIALIEALGYTLEIIPAWERNKAVYDEHIRWAKERKIDSYISEFENMLAVAVKAHDEEYTAFLRKYINLLSEYQNILRG